MLVEKIPIDETYVGGKQKGRRGRGASGKTAVLGLVERNGRVYAQPVSNIKAKTLQKVVREKVVKGSNIMTDELRSYNGLGIDYTHETVSHGRGEYVPETFIQTRLKAIGVC